MATLLALLAAVGWGSSDYAAGNASRRSSAVSVVILTHFVAVIALLFVAVDLGPLFTSIVELARPDRDGAVDWQWPVVAGSPQLVDIGWGLAAGLGGGFGAMLLFRGLGRGSMAVVAPITAAGAASVPVLLGVVTGDSLGPTAIAGIVLALAAIVLVSLGGDATPTDDADELTIPPEWTQQFGSADGVDRGHGVPFLPSPDAAGRVGTMPAPGVTQVDAEVSRAAVATPALPGDEPEQRMLRVVTSAMVLLLVALVIGALGMAVAPVTALTSGESLTAAHAVMLAFAAISLTISVVGLRVVRPLYTMVGAVPGAVSGVATPATPRVPAWRRVLAQPGLPEALLSGIGFGAFYVFIDRASATAGHWPLVSARGTSVVLFTIVALATSTSVLPVRGGRAPVALAGVFDATAAVAFVLALNAGLLSIGSVLASLYPAVTVVLARAHGGERVSPRQLVGLGIALGAVVLLAL